MVWKRRRNWLQSGICLQNNLHEGKQNSSTSKWQIHVLNWFGLYLSDYLSEHKWRNIEGDYSSTSLHSKQSRKEMLSNSDGTVIYTLHIPSFTRSHYHFS